MGMGLGIFMFLLEFLQGEENNGLGMEGTLEASFEGSTKVQTLKAMHEVIDDQIV